MPELNKKLSCPPFNDRHNANMLRWLIEDYLTSLENIDRFVYFRFFFLFLFFYYSCYDLFLPTHCRYRGLLLNLITLSDTYTRQYSSGRRICPSQTLTWQHTENIHAPGGIRGRNANKRAAVDPRLRPRGHWDRRICILNSIKYEILFVGWGKVPSLNTHDELLFFDKCRQNAHWVVFLRPKNLENVRVNSIISLVAKRGLGTVLQPHLTS
jgi:hypothetical protein